MAFGDGLEVCVAIMLLTMRLTTVSQTSLRR